VDLIRKLARELSDRDVPAQISELEKLPAIGRYVAAAHSSLHRNHRGVIIDANVVRWICRLIGVEPRPETRRERWMTDMADGLTPKKVFRDYNYAVLDLSMTICTTRPKCNMCPVIKFCNYGSRNS
jgi:A/G-specific adenine glycosylase